MVDNHFHLRIDLVVSAGLDLKHFENGFFFEWWL